MEKECQLLSREAAEANCVKQKESKWMDLDL